MNSKTEVLVKPYACGCPNRGVRFMIIKSKAGLHPALPHFNLLIYVSKSKLLIKLM